MNEKKIKSYAKINLSLGILGKFNLKYHKIESIVSLINLYDDISIKKINTKKHQIIFYGREYCTARGCDGRVCEICITCYPKRRKPFKSLKA